MWLERISPQINRVWAGSWPQGCLEAARRLYDHELVVFTQGECIVRLDEQEYRCSRGTYMILPPDRVHTSVAVSAKPVHRYCIHFDWVYSPRTEQLPYCVFLPGKLKKGGVRYAPAWVPPRLHGRVPDELATLHLLQKILECSHSTDAAVRASSRAYFLELLIGLLATPGTYAQTPAHDGGLAARVKALLDERYTPEDSIQDLLGQLDYSYEHLCRKFKQYYGISPLGYVNAQRIERAKSLLRGAHARVKNVAREVGIEDPAYFSRLFRKMVGISPVSFARQATPQHPSQPTDAKNTGEQ
jgi:AraC-like DNA-binding protein